MTFPEMEAGTRLAASKVERQSGRGELPMAVRCLRSYWNSQLSAGGNLTLRSACCELTHLTEPFCPDSDFLFGQQLSSGRVVRRRYYPKRQQVQTTRVDDD